MTKTSSRKRQVGKPMTIGGVLLKRGRRRRLEIPVARLPTGTALSLPVTVLRGKHDGPTVWLSAAVHGDEVNGTEIIRRVVKRLNAATLHGTLITAPIVNVYGFIERSRYLPDRRDLNRSFPGSRSGSLASRLAHLFLQEVVSHCSHGIDFHTGAQHRTNLPHVRADLDDPEARRLAEAFGAPLMFNSARIKGSLRAEAYRRKIPILVFEGGRPLEFDADVIEAGVDGTLRVLAALGMVGSEAAPELARKPSEATMARWLRAGRSGIMRLETSLGERVDKGDVLAWISDPLSGRRRSVTAPIAGIVFAQTTTPLVYQGDAVLRLAPLGKKSVEKRTVKKKAAKKKAVNKRAAKKKPAKRRPVLKKAVKKKPGA
jgi:predicted deacylase